MRSILIRSALALAGLAIVWLLTARQLTLLLDRISTLRVRKLPADPITKDSWDRLQLGGLTFVFAGDAEPAQLRLYNGYRNRVLLATGEQTFALGAAEGETIHQDPGDEVELTLDRSRLSWPTPFEMNFMTGHSPSWKRNIYYHLVWKKKNGAKLDLLWRFEEWFYDRDGWSGMMTRQGATGMIRKELRPSPAEQVVVDHISRTRQWNRAEYRIENQAPMENGQDLIAVIHRQDERSPVAGAGKSIELLVDPAKRKVVKETAWQ